MKNENKFSTGDLNFACALMSLGIPLTESKPCSIIAHENGHTYSRYHFESHSVCGKHITSDMNNAWRISPPAWGWPGSHRTASPAGYDFPTRVGMAREFTRGPRDEKRFPHPRGDGPPIINALRLSLRISPPAWGWPAWSA